MNFCARRFNLYLLIPLLLMLAAGCATDKKDEKMGGLRLHIESTANAPDSAKVISVLRDKPVNVTVAPDPVLTEADIVAAKLLETPGGFAVEVKFDQTGTWLLEQYTATNPGKHFVIFGQWGDKLASTRWLAAPIITHRIGDGVFSFTPDADRDEMTQLVLGLNNFAKKKAKDLMK